MGVSQYPAKADENLSAQRPARFPDAHAVWLSGGVAVLDDSGKILSVNDTLASWLEAAPGDWSGVTLPDWIGGRFPEWTEPLRTPLKGSLAFDRLELTALPERGAHKVAVELCRHDRVR